MTVNLTGVRTLAADGPVHFECRDLDTAVFLKNARLVATKVGAIG
jgi:hypothetical protein